ncbi:GntP family permease [Marinigracilibium pacificum]|uniref:Gluconate transporter n=1 Tax=Marinigracilibium pacificum TaxID=2729599 RepID=A0A848JCD7_9BACT|nr:gluconate:H+ symporter [Marinigracilibium pacificum]NMM50662.1 gluconate transporter [Marinigracilibium pacificum]
MDYNLLLAVFTGIAVLLILILKVKLHAFPSLLIASITVGVLAGLEPIAIMDTINQGMANTLGFVATVVGLGAMFGAILEHSGGAKIVADFLIKKFGVKNASGAMAVAGFIIAIPVFFEVGFILLVPMIYALHKQTGKSLLVFALPLLAGLAVTHAFMPPTPGPIAVADIIGADLGWVILIGGLVGLPSAIIGGILYGKFIGNKIFIGLPALSNINNSVSEENNKKQPNIYTILVIIGIPIFLILLSTFNSSGLLPVSNQAFSKAITLIGHPFAALIIANIVAWYLLGIKLGFTKEELLDISTKSLGPAGLIILITGAGGVFKQVLVNTGAGEMLANNLSEIGFPVLIFAFIVALLIRIMQGSSTVAMITAAGLVSPLIMDDTSSFSLACLVIAIAAGGTFMSHVNDSGFWMVKELLGITEKQTFKTWTIMTGIIAVSGFIMVMLIHSLFQ